MNFRKIKLKILNKSDSLDIQSIKSDLSPQISVELVDHVDENTLLYCNDLSEINEAVSHVLCSTEDCLIEGIRTFSRFLEKSYFKSFMTSIKITSNNYHEAKEKFKKHLLGVYGSKKKFLSEVNLITDELLMNAFFNAPVDLKNKHTHKHIDRFNNVVLKDHSTDISLLLDSDENVIRCMDLYGSLKKRSIINLIKDGQNADINSLSEDRKGAGIGLSLLFNYSDVLLFNLKENEFTDIYSMKFNRSKKFKLLSIISDLKTYDPYHVERLGDCILIKINYNIDEGTSFSGFDSDSIKKIFVDFSNVGSINNIGARNWIDFVEQTTVDKIIIRNCSRLVFELIANFKGFVSEKVEFENLEFVYVCPKCNMEYGNFLKPVDFLNSKESDLSECFCDKCSHKLKPKKLSSKIMKMLKKL